MNNKWLPALNLRLLIVSFALLITLITLCNSFYSAYRVQRQVLIDHALEQNQAYAERVASSIERYLNVAQERLAYGARFWATIFIIRGCSMASRSACNSRILTLTPSVWLAPMVGYCHPSRRSMIWWGRC